MTSIHIVSEEPIDSGWRFTVTLRDRRAATIHTVTVDSAYWKALTNQAVDPRVLIKQSLEFLLQKEPKEAILSSFNVRDISHYFPEYEQHIKSL